MQNLSGFPYFEVQFTKDGDVFQDAAVADGLQTIADAAPTDLIVVSHGWNNDMADARALYVRFFQCIRAMLASSGPANATRKFAVMGVLWPSKKFADQDLVAGGAASAGSVVSETVVKEHLDDLKAVFDDPASSATIEQAKALVGRLDDGPAARTEFTDLIRSLLHRNSADDEDASGSFFGLPGEEVMQRLSKPVMPAPPTSGSSHAATSLGGNAVGSAAGLGQFFSGIKSAALNLANLATYYTMKDRAGKVGFGGLFDTLQRIRVASPTIKLHLVGHSFGGRVVTAASTGPSGNTPLNIESLTLLQTAYSHYGLAQNYEAGKDGFFRRMITARNVSGPIVISCTKNDQAVGKAYPLASLIAGQVAAALGDKNDRYGGLGRNGAQKTPEAHDGTLLPVGQVYAFTGGAIYNLNADAFIMGHSDICKNEVAQALLASIATT